MRFYCTNIHEYNHVMSVNYYFSNIYLSCYEITVIRVQV